MKRTIRIRIAKDEVQKIFTYLLICLFFSLLLPSCDDGIWIWDSAETRKQKIIKQQEADKKELLILESLSLFSSSEAIALIAAKYNIDEHKIVSLYKIYTKKTSEIKVQSIDELSKTINNTQGNDVPYTIVYSKLLDELSSTYDIEKGILASLITEIKLLDEKSF